MKMKIGFIGCGNMGGALASAAAKQPNDIFLADNDIEKRDALAQKLSANISSNEEICRECDYIFLGVKPQVLFSLLADIAPVLSAREDRFVLVSMAAGVPSDRVSEAVGTAPVIRIMPNTPVAVGEGMIVYCGNDRVTEDDKTAFCEFMSASGKLDEIKEELIDAATVVSGCGPAFVYMFIKALADGGAECGLADDKALAFAAQTVFGSALNLMQSDKTPRELIDAVCSPGGSTIEGVRSLEGDDLSGIISAAVAKSFKRTQELGK
ncbi:MAG: pyrroline-5-carboxylate reductase [Clostridia bacterium]|nr:pyrroline-5-carboxylate reductase [Clostridia bacterium]